MTRDNRNDILINLVLRRTRWGAMTLAVAIALATVPGHAQTGKTHQLKATSALDSRWGYYDAAG